MTAMSGNNIFNYAGSPLTSFERRRRRYPIATVVRLFVGAVFIVIGLNGLLHFLPELDQSSQLEGFVKVVRGSGFHNLIMGWQVFGGLCVLSSRLVNLGIFLLGPVMVQVVLFHIFMTREGLGLALVMVACFLYLVWRNRHVWVQVLFSRGR